MEIMSATDRFSKSCCDRKARTIRLTWVDAAILLGFALFSLGSFLGRWKGITPFVFLGSDAGIVSSFVAAYEHPELFRGDALLCDFGNFRYYLAAHPLLIYTISKATGDYGSAYISLLLITPLLQASGFYVLGRVLFNSRYWALLLSIITLCPVALPIREFWGIYDDPLPRSLFHACIPYVLAGAFYFRHDHNIWPWLMAATGLLFYAHPVSSPHWAFGIWLGMCAFLPRDWGLTKKLLYMFALGLIYLAVALPWAANFLQVHDQAGVTGIQYSQVVSIIADRVGTELLSVSLALQMWGRELLSWPLWFFSSWALCAMAVVSFLHPETRKSFLLVTLWGLGILAVAVGITFAEEMTCRNWNLPRFQMDSIRGIKYLVPIFLLFSLWPLAEISNRLPTRSLRKAGLTLAGTLLVAIWVYQNPPTYFLNTMQSWAQFRLMPPVSGTETAIIQAVDAIREKTPPGARILPIVLPLETRYAALRSVVYAYKDGGIFADTNYRALLEWNKIKQELEQILEHEVDPSTKLRRLLELSGKLSGQYVVTDFRIDDSLASSLGAKVVWANELFTLLRCPPRPQ